MITIIIGICLILLSFKFIEKKIGKWWMPFWLIVLGFVVIIVGIVAPLNGYNEYNEREKN